MYTQLGMFFLLPILKLEPNSQIVSLALFLKLAARSRYVPCSPANFIVQVS